MRTVVLQDVIDGVLRKHGMDPLGDAIRQDTLRSIIQHINKRVRTAWTTYEWPELDNTEERAFRTIWSSTKLFYRVNAEGKPDELFYMPTAGTLEGAAYYKVKSSAPGDPPAGTLPTNTTYFELLDPVDAYISLDQICRRPIGMVFGVYSSNPRLNGCCVGLPYRPSEKGIDVYGSHGPSVYIRFQLPCSQFSAVPYAAGKQYYTGNRVFYTVTGESYIATADNINVLPTDVNFWRIIPFPETFSDYVVAGAYADGLDETGPYPQNPNAADIQVRQAAAQIADRKADKLLEDEMDGLMAQNYTQHYNFKKWVPCSYGIVCISPPWTGTSVTTLTEICETDPTYPPAALPAFVQWQYHPEIVALLTASGTPSLQQYPTVSLATGTLFEIVILVGGVYEHQEWQLRSGAASGSDVPPADYHATTNNKHWTKVG